MNREELDLTIADVEANEKLSKAKEVYRKFPTPANKVKLTEAKREIYDLRVKWRTIRAEFGYQVVVPTLKAKASN